MGCLSGCLMSYASIHKLFCGLCSAFKCSFNEFGWGGGSGLPIVFLHHLRTPPTHAPTHVPFSLSDMSQIEEKLGSFSENPTRYRKKFLRLSQAYNLTWSDVYYILNATLAPHEKDRICQAVKAHADHLHNQDWDIPVADEVVPQLDPHWTHQPGDPGFRRLNHMITSLLKGIQKNTHIHVNYDKVKEITQGSDKNPALFLACLTEAVQKYTNLDVTTPAGFLYLSVQFISWQGGVRSI